MHVARHLASSPIDLFNAVQNSSKYRVFYLTDVLLYICPGLPFFEHLPQANVYFCLGQMIPENIWRKLADPKKLDIRGELKNRTNRWLITLPMGSLLPSRANATEAQTLEHFHRDYIRQGLVHKKSHKRCILFTL